MFYKSRELQRLWETEIYEEDPNNHPDTATRRITIVAWNAVGAIRSAARWVARQPIPLHYVTHPDHDETGEDRIFRINNAREGPVGPPLNPTIGAKSPDDW
jgi:hypothetical protein